jgi:hypothetical protein
MAINSAYRLCRGLVGKPASSVAAWVIGDLPATLPGLPADIGGNLIFRSLKPALSLGLPLTEVTAPKGDYPADNRNHPNRVWG